MREKVKFEHLINKYFAYLDQQGRRFNFAVALICTALLGIVDAQSAEDMSLALFYVLPICFAAWFAGRKAGLALALICTATWGAAHRFPGMPYILASNILTFSGFFVVVAVLFSKLREILDREHSQSRTDYLTGAMNSRAFYEMAHSEILRSSRQKTSFTIAYVDIDNFKEINDLYGHNNGDNLLRSVVAVILQNIRQTDVVARLGGDEFIILLPDTDPDGAHTLIPKLHEQLKTVVSRDNWPVSFSIGVLTCCTSPPNVYEIITIADKLMYEVKNSGKNGIRFGVYDKAVL